MVRESLAELYQALAGEYPVNAGQITQLISHDWYFTIPKAKRY
jgi:hypothetical protein